MFNFDPDGELIASHEKMRAAQAEAHRHQIARLYRESPPAWQRAADALLVRLAAGAVRRQSQRV